MKTRDGPYRYPEENDSRPEAEQQCTTPLDAEWAEVDNWFRTIQREMRAGYKDSNELTQAIERTFDRFTSALSYFALSKLEEYRCPFPEDRGFTAAEIAIDALHDFLTIQLPGIEPGVTFVYTHPKAAIGYVRKSVINAAIDFGNRQCKYPQVNVDDLERQGHGLQAADPEVIREFDTVEADKPPVAEIIKKARLTKREEKVIRLSFFGDKKVHEIADLIGEKPHRVSCIRHRALQKMSKVIHRDDEDGWRITKL